MTTRRRRNTFKPSIPPPPPPPTPEEREAALVEAEAALHDASEAVSLVRMEIVEMRRQQAQVKSLRADLDRFIREKAALEERLYRLTSVMPSRDANQAHKHAQRMRRLAIFWEAEAMKLGHRGRSGLQDYHFAKHF
jgi:hypothetical protein